MTLRLVIADDHSVVLDGLRALLSLEPGLEVSALCRDGLEAMEAVDLHSPDVLVMDATMPHCGGLEAHELLRERGVRVATVILSAALDDESILRCLKGSVEGIVLKESAANVLIDAVRAVARGERWIPPELTARAIELMARRARPGFPHPPGEGDRRGGGGRQIQQAGRRRPQHLPEHGQAPPPQRLHQTGCRQPRPTQPAGPGKGLDLGDFRHTYPKVLVGSAGSSMAPHPLLPER